MTPINDIDEQTRNEENTKLKYITPELIKKWSAEGDQIVMEYGKTAFTDGQILVDSDGTVTRGERKKVDYLLLYKYNLPLALVEAKGIDHDVHDGVSQAIEYAKLLDVPFAYASNGKCFHEEDMDMGTNREFPMNEFPTSDELWERYKKNNNISDEQNSLITVPYYQGTDGRKPRYYQRNAINRCIDRIAKGQQKLLLVMATGTGKTFVAMQIIYRLYEAGKKKKILFLVDRTSLAAQTFDDFTAFHKMNNMVRIGEHINLRTEEDVKKLSSYEVFISLYQQLKSGRSEDEDDRNPDDEPTADKDYYKLLPANFFDLIVVDECHRGSLNEEKSWHEMLEYFGSATQIGLTATPKQTNSGSNLEYFGDPVYVYSLKQGIADGFLSPYVVMAHELDIDRDGYKPKKGEKDIHGKPLEDRVYLMPEFDRKLIIDERRKLVATKITEFLKEHDRFTKTIVFCETEEHAGAMRDYLANENADLMKESNQRYVMRITANDQAGKDQIKNFSSTSQKYPVIAVTSKLLSTGVDTKTVGLIVLDKTIGSMTEFKQTIGRGTRIVEKYQFENESEERTKTHFVIMDFRKNYLKFDDPDFDGIVDVVPGGTAVPLSTKTKKKREVFRIKGVDVELVDTSIRYLDDNMNLVREESVESCVRKNVEDLFPTFEDFYTTWSKLDVAEVKDGMLMDLLISEKVVTKLRDIVGKEVDLFDLVCHFGYGKAISSKQERVNKARELIKHLNPEQQKIMNLVIDLYKETDFSNLKTIDIFGMPYFQQNGYSYKTAVKTVGGEEAYEEIILEIEKELYK